MMIGVNRKCDVCGADIPRGQQFKVSIAPREALATFLNVDDADIQPTWQEVGDGSGRIRLDICLECAGQTGSAGIGSSS